MFSVIKNRFYRHNGQTVKMVVFTTENENDATKEARRLTEKYKLYNEIAVGKQSVSFTIE